MRINHQGQYRPQDSVDWQSLATVVPCTGRSWSGPITCFKTNPLDCTLLARWDDGYTDPWLILTDLKSTEANVLWYSPSLPCRLLPISFNHFRALTFSDSS